MTRVNMHEHRRATRKARGSTNFQAQSVTWTQQWLGERLEMDQIARCELSVVLMTLVSILAVSVN